MIPTDMSPTPAMDADVPEVAWYFDVISPFAWLAWPKVRELAKRQPVALRPVLLAGLLGHHGQKGPAEIEPKRLFTYRHVLWQARRRGIPLVFPPGHPFNPLPALRLIVALGSTPAALDAVFDWIWARGHAADSVEALAPLARSLGIEDLATTLATPAVRDTLRANFDDAVAAGVFGVPTLAVGDDLFWGEDALDFALATLADPGLLKDPEMHRLTTLPTSARRR